MWSGTVEDESIGSDAGSCAAGAGSPARAAQLNKRTDETI